MVKPPDPAVAAALVTAGLFDATEIDKISRIIIDIPHDSLPVMYVQRFIDQDHLSAFLSAVLPSVSIVDSGGSRTANTSGKRAYQAYRLASQGRSLATGDTLPDWDDMPVSIRLAWQSAAVAARAGTE